MNEVQRIGQIAMIQNAHPGKGRRPEFLSEESPLAARHYHGSLPDYQPTPLVCLSDLAKKMGVKDIFIKDESYRFGLNAFKGLGGTYALCRVVCEELCLNPATVTLEELRKPENLEKIQKMVFVTTTDGNHGKGVSWAAGLLGCEAHVFMPKGSVEARAQAIRDAGKAEVVITDLGYDDAVRYAAKMATENGWFLVQDTSWPGYDKVPSWIIQGYTTMVYEALTQLAVAGYKRPTHVFLQAGVGAMAGGVLGYLACVYGDDLPTVSIVEPSEVACIFESARHEDGEAHKATGSEVTIMAGLNCGEPCLVTWPILRDFASHYFACPDEVSARGMRILAAPEGNDPTVKSGESGAVTAGLLSMLLEYEEYQPIREKLGLNENSVILLFNTEGDTDPEGYREIVYNGAHPMTTH